MRPAITVSLLLAALVTSPVQADLIDVSPAQPTDLDTVTVTVHGCLAPCWLADGRYCSAEPDKILEVVVDRYYVFPVCIPECAPYSRECRFGPLAPGGYVVIFTERPTSLDDPLGTLVYTAGFSVSPSTPTIPLTWGRLKVTYR